MGEAEAVPSRRGPVVDGDEEGGAAGGQGNAEGAAGRGGQVLLAGPAAQQILHGGGVGRGVRVWVIQRVAGGAAQAFPFGRAALGRGVVGAGAALRSGGCLGMVERVRGGAVLGVVFKFGVPRGWFCLGRAAVSWAVSGSCCAGPKGDRFAGDLGQMSGRIAWR